MTTKTPENFFEEIQTVRFQHCDPAGIVFYPRYYEMLNLTVERFFESHIGWSFHQLHMDLHVTVPTVRIETDFLRPAGLKTVCNFSCGWIGLDGRVWRLTFPVVVVTRSD